MNVLIIEDETLSAERLQRLLLRQPGTQVVGRLPSVRKGREWLATQPPLPDLILADIQLTDGLSFELLRELPRPVPIIFCTAYDEYALQAFKYNGFDYLLKPLEEEALAESLARFRQHNEDHSGAAAPQNAPAAPAPDLAALLAAWQAERSYRSRFLVSVRDELRLVDIAEVSYFHLENKLTHLVCHNGTRLVLDEPLEALESSLDPRQFFRLTRQHLVRPAAIGTMHRHFDGKLKVQLVPGREEVLVSRLTVPALKQWLSR